MTTNSNVNGRPTVENVNATVNVVDRATVPYTQTSGQAFQPTAFQPTSFQATAYRDAFAAGFQPKRAFQRIAGPTPPEQDGRSGYWRLFFMKMQEEALQKTDGAPTAKETPEGGVAENNRAKKKTKKRVKQAPVVELAPKSPELLPPVHIQPAPTVSEDLPQLLMQFSIERSIWLEAFQPYAAQFALNELKIIQQREAANDADIRLRLLLLAAA